jgi:hypothetical protein
METGDFSGLLGVRFEETALFSPKTGEQFSPWKLTGRWDYAGAGLWRAGLDDGSPTFGSEPTVTDSTGRDGSFNPLTDIEHRIEDAWNKAKESVKAALRPVPFCDAVAASQKGPDEYAESIGRGYARGLASERINGKFGASMNSLGSGIAIMQASEAARLACENP